MTLPLLPKARPRYWVNRASGISREKSGARPQGCNRNEPLTQAKGAPNGSGYSRPSPTPARPYSDPDANPRPVNSNSGSVISAVISGIAVVRRVAAVIAAVITSPTDQRASDTPSPAPDRFNGAGLLDCGANCRRSTQCHSLSAANRQKGCCRDRDRSSSRQNQFSHCFLHCRERQRSGLISCEASQALPRLSAWLIAADVPVPTPSHLAARPPLARYSCEGVRLARAGLAMFSRVCPGFHRAS